MCMSITYYVIDGNLYINIWLVRNDHHTIHNSIRMMHMSVQYKMYFDSDVFSTQEFIIVIFQITVAKSDYCYYMKPEK